MQPSDIEILLHAFQLDMTEQEGAVDVALGLANDYNNLHIF